MCTVALCTPHLFVVGASSGLCSGSLLPLGRCSGTGRETGQDPHASTGHVVPRWPPGPSAVTPQSLASKGAGETVAPGRLGLAVSGGAGLAGLWVGLCGAPGNPSAACFGC